MKTFGLEGSKILVTGAAGFLGQYLTFALMEEKAQVFGTDVQKSGLADTLDISDPEDIDRYIEQLGTDGIVLDGLVNCSVLSFKGKSISNKKFNKTMFINIKGAYNCMDAFKSLMSDNASVVSVSSVFGSKIPDFSNYDGNEDLFNNVSYGCSKSAVEYISKYYAKLYAPIRYNCVSPGGILQEHSQNFVDKYVRQVALGRMANPEEVVNVILFLLSELSSYITGANIRVDGGFGL